jgi:hypothetical protein
MNTLEDPFDYPEPFKPKDIPEKAEELREKRRAYRAKKLGRPVGKHGGYRPGAGRPRVRNYTHIAYVMLDSIQVKLLQDLGQGDINQGIQAAIERFTDG